MNDLSIIEKLELHYRHPDRQPMTEQMELYMSKMEYCYDIVVKFSQKIVIELLRRKFPGISRSQAYNIYNDTLEFYEKERGKSYKSEFWKIAAIDYLEELKKKAEAMAKSPKDFAYVSKIQSDINKLRGFNDKNPAIDPENLKPATILISIAGQHGENMQIELGKKPEGLPDGFVPTVDAVDFTVEDMQKELKKIGK
ncbi:hypothetical protein QQ054_32125 [Oscillatoria amoena NRMC-F 0135]|nr:hypothetical protein [Oscillatoria amoena NRMC-F 0135]